MVIAILPRGSTMKLAIGRREVFGCLGTAYGLCGSERWQQRHRSEEHHSQEMCGTFQASKL